MRTPTRVFDVQDWLVDNLPTVPGIAPGMVSDGWPAPDTAPVEFVAVLNAVDDSDWAAIGNREREERFDVRIVISVTKHGGSNREVRHRVRDIFYAIDLFLRASQSAVTLGGLVQKAVIGHTEIHSGVWDTGRMCEMRCDLKVVARI